jgi:prepilin-type N-terminal cleavage/methylation domain-containing protein
VRVTSLRRDHDRDRDRHDRGFTVIELAITMMILGVVSSSVLGILVSQSRAERRTSLAADNQELLRQALIEVAEDVRASDPILYQANVGDFATALPVRVRELTDAGDRNLRWRLDTVNQELVREELDAAGTSVTGVSYRVAGITNSTPFTYYRADGSAYTLTGLDAGAVDRCTVRVHITLTGAPSRGPKETTVETDVQVRNRLPLPNEVWCTS